MHRGKRHSLVSLLEAALGRCTGRLTSTDSIASTSQNPDGKYMCFFFFLNTNQEVMSLLFELLLPETPNYQQIQRSSKAPLHTIKIKKGIRNADLISTGFQRQHVGSYATKRKQKKNTKAKYYTSFLKGKVSNFHTDGLSCHHNVLFLKAERSGD